MNQTNEEAHKGNISELVRIIKPVKQAGIRTNCSMAGNLVAMIS